MTPADTPSRSSWLKAARILIGVFLVLTGCLSVFWLAVVFPIAAQGVPLGALPSVIYMISFLAFAYASFKAVASIGTGAPLWVIGVFLAAMLPFAIDVFLFPTSDTPDWRLIALMALPPLAMWLTRRLALRTQTAS